MSCNNDIYDVVMFLTHLFFTTNVKVLNLFLFSIETHEKLCVGIYKPP
jgi:hypothetical protein